MSLSNPRNVCFLGMLLLIAILVPIFMSRAEEERIQAIRFQRRFMGIDQLIKKGQFKESITVLKELEKEQPNDYRVLWQIGISMFQSGDVPGSDQYLTKTLARNPLMVFETDYLLQVAQVKLLLGQYNIAYAYLKHCQDKPLSKEKKQYWGELAATLGFRSPLYRGLLTQ